MEAEFIALKLAGQEADWLKGLLANMSLGGGETAYDYFSSL